MEDAFGTSFHTIGDQISHLEQKESQMLEDLQMTIAQHHQIALITGRESSQSRHNQHLSLESPKEKLSSRLKRKLWNMSPN